MPWVKGQSGNPGGRPKQSTEVSALAKAEAPKAFKKLIRLANGQPATDRGDPPTNREILRAQEMLFERAWGRPAAPESAGLYEGMTIIVDTGIHRTRLNPPTIDATPVDEDQPAVNETDQPE
jgi:hypothetical protein